MCVLKYFNILYPQEVEEGQPLGVMIGDCNDKGNAKLSGKIVKGLFLCSANDIDLKYKTFDEILDVFGGFKEGQTVKLTLINPKDVFKGPAILNVKIPNGDVIQVKSLKGQNLRQVLMENKIEVYGGKAKLTNCNGGLSCGTCVVEVTSNKDWENRPDVERLRLKKYNENARLSCNTIIEGDCEIKIQPVP